jgi:hypothetical protein
VLLRRTIRTFARLLIVIFDTPLIPFYIAAKFTNFYIETKSKGSVKDLVIG